MLQMLNTINLHSLSPTAPIITVLYATKRTKWFWPINQWQASILRTFNELSIYTVKPRNHREPNPNTYMFLFSSCNCLCPIHWSHALRRGWRCSVDRRCSNYIWVINKFIAYLRFHTRGLTGISLCTFYLQIHPQTSTVAPLMFGNGY